jgi:FMN-dependent NADH-azoreductase
MKILHLDSSGRTDGSETRHLGSYVIAELKRRFPSAAITYRDLTSSGIGFVNETWVQAAFTPADHRTAEQKQALALSEALIDELFAADLIVVGAPMYNFGVPAAMKAYIDQVVRAGRTFNFLANGGYEGLVKGKKMLVLSARGGSGYEPGQPGAFLNFQTQYLKATFGFLGITEFESVSVDDTARSDRSLSAESRKKAEATISNFIGSL